MVAASVKPYRLQRKTTLFKGGFLLMLLIELLGVLEVLVFDFLILW